MEPSGTSSSPSTPILETDYGYDALGNLLRVDQCGGACSLSSHHVRQFAYDVAGRLIASNNPENASPTAYQTYPGLLGTWTTLYSYDNDSNLTSRVNNQGIVNSYTYDQLNRLLTKTYSDGTPPVTLTYDIVPPSISGSITGPELNLIGQLTGAQAGSGSIMAQQLMTNYDKMGRIWNEQQCTPANCSGNTSSAQVGYSLGYSYDLTGFVTQSTNSAGMYSASTTDPGYQQLTLNNTPDIAERLTQINSYWNDKNPSVQTPNDAYHPSILFQASSSSAPYGYGPMGLQNATLGVNSQAGTSTGTLSRSYDNRGRTIFEADSGQGTAPIATTDSTGSITIGEQDVNGQGEQYLVRADIYANASISISGSDGSYPVCTGTPNTAGYSCTSAPDTGSVTLTVNTTPVTPFSVTYSYGSGDNFISVAKALAYLFNGQGNPVTATADNYGNITLKANFLGAAYDYPFSISFDPDRRVNNTAGVNDFYATISGATTLNGITSMSNGSIGGTYYDEGTITATISGTPVSVNFGACSSTTSIASSLASAINAQAGNFVSASVSGATISLKSAQGGDNANWDLYASLTWDAADFCTSTSCVPSYTVDVSGGTNSATASTGGEMSGGNDATNSLVYWFAIPDSGGFDLAGNLLNVTDSVMGTWSYSYDNLNRLTGASSGTNAPSGFQNLTGCWSYDAFGNRTMQGMLSGSCSSQTASTSVYNIRNQVSGVIPPGATQASPSPVTYDQTGDVNNDYVTGNSYQYDAEGRLCGVYSPGKGFTGYFYDAAGTRVAKGSISTLNCNFATNHFAPTTSYVLGLKGEQITELSVTGTGSYVSAWTHANVFDGLGLAATYSLTGSASHPTSTYFALNDWLGTKRAEVGYIVGSNGAPQPCVSNFASLPYGDGLTPSGNCPDATEHHYTGKERDAESGNDYFGARYYSSAMGRFMSPDFTGDDDEPTAIPYGDLENPQSLNLYASVNNNPLSNVDDDGHKTEFVCTPCSAIWNWMKGLFSGGGGSSDNGDHAPSNPPPSDPNYRPQLHTRPAASQPFNNQAFANYMDSHYPNTKGDRHCARGCRLGMEAGGMNTNGRPGDAKNYGPFLLQHGYHTVPGASYFGNEQVGDVAVFQPAPGHSQSGHIEMWDGKRWVSDFSQQHFSPYKGFDQSNLNYKIYRHN